MAYHSSGKLDENGPLLVDDCLIVTLGYAVEVVEGVIGNKSKNVKIAEMECPFETLEDGRHYIESSGAAYIDTGYKPTLASPLYEDCEVAPPTVVAIPGSIAAPWSVGENVTAYMTETGTLVIGGTGAMDVYTSDTVTNQNWSVATNGVIEVPAPGKQGFFYLMSKPAVK